MAKEIRRTCRAGPTQREGATGQRCARPPNPLLRPAGDPNKPQPAHAVGPRAPPGVYPRRSIPARHRLRNRPAPSWPRLPARTQLAAVGSSFRSIASPRPRANGSHRFRILLDPRPAGPDHSSHGLASARTHPPTASHLRGWIRPCPPTRPPAWPRPSPPSTPSWPTSALSWRPGTARRGPHPSAGGPGGPAGGCSGSSPGRAGTDESATACAESGETPYPNLGDWSGKSGNSESSCPARRRDLGLVEPPPPPSGAAAGPRGCESPAGHFFF